MIRLLCDGGGSRLLHSNGWDDVVSQELNSLKLLVARPGSI